MATTLTSEQELRDFLDLNLTPEPIVIGKGGYYAITNYSLGSDITFVTEDTIAGELFFKQIYDPTIIVNLVIGDGVTLTLSRDIFIAGSLMNFGFIVGGQVFETDIPLILEGMTHSWESDLGVLNSEEIEIQCESANEEYLALPSLTVQDNNSTFEFNVVLPVGITATGFISNGTTTFFMSAAADGSLFIQTNSGSGFFGIGQLIAGSNNIKYRRDATDNFLTINGNPEISVTDNTAFEFFHFARRTTTFSNISILNFTLNDELFPCNEGTGVTTTGSLGGIATLNSNATVEDMWFSVSNIQSWIDNIALVNLEPPSPTQSPIFSSSDSDFKNLPSLQGESSLERQLKSVEGLNINSFQVTVFMVKLDTTSANIETDVTLGEVDPRFFVEKNGSNEQRAFAIGNVGNVVADLPGTLEVSVYRSTWDISLPTDETNVFRNGSNAGLIRGANLNNTEQMGSGMPLTMFSRFDDIQFSNMKTPVLLIYPQILDAENITEIEQYLTNKYIP